MPKVSILMPIYNSEKYLKNAVESILNQTYRDFELIIISEYACEDNSINIINNYISRDSRIMLFQNNEKLGIAASLNKGIRHSKGEFIARMDADDISFPERIEYQVSFMERHQDIAICGTEVEYIDEKGCVNRIFRDNFPAEHEDIKAGLLFFCYLRHPAVMMRKEAIELFNLKYNNEYLAAEDYELWSRACHFIKIGNISKVLLKYRFHEANATGLRKDEGTKNYIKVMEENFKRLDINFTYEELELLCPLTCKFDESNKNYVIKTLLDCEKIIIKSNNEKCIYDKNALKLVLEKRFGWARHKYRHKFVTLCRGIADKLENYSNSTFNKKVAYLIIKFSNHLEIHGIRLVLKRLLCIKN